MPCCSCTTGSPMRTSDRSRTIASTFVRFAASRAARRTTPAYSSASVTNASPASGHANPACERRGRERQLLVACQERREVVDERRLQAVLGEVLLHRLAAAGAFGHDQHASVGRGEEALQRSQRIVGAAVDLHRRQAARRRLGRQRRTRVGDGELDAAERLHRAVERVRRQEQLASAAAADAPCRRAAAGSATRCPARSGRPPRRRRRAARRPCAAADSRRASPSRRRTAAGSTRCPPGTMPLVTSLYSGDFDGSPSNTSRKRLRKRVRPASSSGNSRAGSSRTSRTG